MPIDLSEVVNDPDLTETWTVVRSTGQFAAGGWQGTPTPIPMRGITGMATDKELQMVPAGDRVLGSRIFISSQPLYITHVGGFSNTTGPSDQIQFGGETWRLTNVGPWWANGFFYAVGVRMSGE